MYILLHAFFHFMFSLFSYVLPFSQHLALNINLGTLITQL
jgi:hypothetical protein